MGVGERSGVVGGVGMGKSERGVRGGGGGGSRSGLGPVSGVGGMEEGRVLERDRDRH